MMAAAADHGGSGSQWQRKRTTAMADKERGGQQRQRMTTARKIGRQTTRGKEENVRQTRTALDKRLMSLPGREHEKINKLSLCKKTFFSNTVCPVGFFAPAKTANVPFSLYLSYLGGLVVLFYVMNAQKLAILAGLGSSFYMLVSQKYGPAQNITQQNTQQPT
jgi:hypothetical protein